MSDNKAEKRSLSKVRRQTVIYGWLFISPLLLGLTLFVLFPLGYAIILAFCEYDLFEAPKFLGMANFFSVFQDEFFWRSMLNALVYCLNIPIRLIIALIIANILAGKTKGSTAFRMIFYVPTVCGAVAITFIWQWMFAAEYGLFHRIMEGLGMEPIVFLDNDHFMPSMIAMSVWCSFGVSLLLLFATIKNADRNCYEAADLDGANAFQKMIWITIPTISPILFYLILTGIIGSFQEFTLFNVMSGNAVTLTNIMPVWWIYQYTGKYGYQYGYASALGVVLGFLLIAISVVQFRVAKKLGSDQ